MIKKVKVQTKIGEKKKTKKSESSTKWKSIEALKSYLMFVFVSVFVFVLVTLVKRQSSKLPWFLLFKAVANKSVDTT